MVTAAYILVGVVVLTLWWRFIAWLYWKQCFKDDEIPSGSYQLDTLTYDEAKLFIGETGSTGITPGGVSYTQPELPRAASRLKRGRR
jgi:hypothetical protein